MKFTSLLLFLFYFVGVASAQEASFDSPISTLADAQEVVDRVAALYPALPPIKTTLSENEWDQWYIELGRPAMNGGINQSLELDIYLTIDQRQIPQVTEAGLAFLVCHEVGHILGGAPYYDDSTYHVGMSVEGQADYFAANDCMPRYFRKMNSISLVGIEEPAEMLEARNQSCGEDRICQQVLYAGMKLIQLFTNRMHPEEDEISYLHKSTQHPKKLISIHPEAQCRLDTFKAAIHGKARPACWFVE